MIAAAVILLALVALLFRLTDAPGPPPAVVRFTLPLPDDTELPDGAQFAVSPDGQHIVVSAREPRGRLGLWIRSLASTEWRELGRTEGAAFPFWSPDSRQVGFFAEKRLKRIDVANGFTYTVCEAAVPRGGAWGSDAFIVFATEAGNLMRVAASGGTPQAVTMGDQARHGQAPAWPHVPPGQGSVIYSASGGGSGQDTESAIYVMSLKNGAPRSLVSGGASAAFAHGWLLFVHGAALIAQPFDPSRAELNGDVQIIRGTEQIGTAAETGAAFSVSRDVLAYRSGGPVASELVWIDRSGRVLGPAVEMAGDYRGFSISPDGDRLVAARRDAQDGSSNIWLMDVRRQTALRLTMGRSPDSSPIWSPDASRIAFASDREGAANVYVTSASGGGKQELLLSSPKPARVALNDWSPDGRALLYSGTSRENGSDLWMLPLDEERKPRPIAGTPFNESDGRLSPDGRFVAYVSDETGRDEVYVQPFPPSPGKWQISTAGGTLPRWRSDGRELLFVTAEGTLVAVPIQLVPPPLRSATPQPLFMMRGVSDYVISRDGSRILARTALRKRGDNELHIVLNWATELRK